MGFQDATCKGPIDTITYEFSDKMKKILEPYQNDQITALPKKFEYKSINVFIKNRSITYSGPLEEPYKAVIKFTSINQMISTLCDKDFYPIQVFKGIDPFYLTSVDLETLEFHFFGTYIQHAMLSFVRNILENINIKQGDIINLLPNFHPSLPTIYTDGYWFQIIAEFLRGKGIDFKILQWSSAGRLHFENSPIEDDILRKIHQYLNKLFTTKEIIIDQTLFKEKSDYFHQWFTNNYRAELDSLFENYYFTKAKFITDNNKVGYKILYLIPNELNTTSDELNEVEERILKIAPGGLYFLQKDTIWNHFETYKVCVHSIDFEFDNKLVLSGLKKHVLFLIVYANYFTSSCLDHIEKDYETERNFFINLLRNEDELRKIINDRIDKTHYLELRNHKIILTMEKANDLVEFNNYSNKFEKIMRSLSKKAYLYVCNIPQETYDQFEEHPNFEIKNFTITVLFSEKLYAIHKSDTAFEMYKKKLANLLELEHKITKDKNSLYIWYYLDEDALKNGIVITNDTIESKIRSLTTDFLSTSLTIHIPCNRNLPAYYFEDILNNFFRDVLSLPNDYGITFSEHNFHLYYFRKKKSGIWRKIFMHIQTSILYEDLINFYINQYLNEGDDLSYLMKPSILKQMLNTDPLWCSFILNPRLKGEVNMAKSRIYMKGVKFHVLFLKAYLFYFSRNIVALKIDQFYISRANLENFLKQYCTQFHIFDTKPYYSLFTTTISSNQVTIIRSLRKVTHKLKIDNPLKIKYLITKKDSYASLTQPFDINRLSNNIVTIECLAMYVEEIEKFITRNISCRVLAPGKISDENYREFEQKMKESNFLVVHLNGGLEVAGITADIIDEIPIHLLN